MNRAEKLKQKGMRNELPAAPVPANKEPATEFEKITRELHNDMLRMEDIVTRAAEMKEELIEIRERFVKNLIYVRDNKKRLLPKGVTFGAYCQSLGKSRQYAYSLIAAFQVCDAHGMPKLIGEVDYKKLEQVSRMPEEKQAAALRNIQEVSRSGKPKKAPMPIIDYLDMRLEKMTPAQRTKEIKKIQKHLKKQYG